MVMVVFDDVFIAPLYDLSEELKIDRHKVTVIESTSVHGSVEPSQGGREQVTVDPATETTLSVRIKGAERELARRLQAWQGQVLLYRDGSSRLMPGVFFTLRIVDRLAEDGCDIFFTLIDTGDTAEV